MKLSPPASSSDIDAAREIARRLNLIATPAEPARPLPSYAPLKEAQEGSLVPPRRPPAPAREAALPPVVASAPEDGPPLAVDAMPPPTPVPAAPPEHTPADAHDEAPPSQPEIHEAPPPPVAETVPEPKSAGVEAPPPPPSPAPVAAIAPPLPEPPRPVAATPSASVEEVEEIEEDMGPDEPRAAIEAAVSAPITWPEIVATCLSLAEAKGALVINAQGRVVAVSGDWPSPGAEAIAARLVPAMDKALKDAPTRSVSVPLGGVHLTAWRAPLAQGLVTVGFVADAPLRPDLRPAIDAIVKKGSEV